MRFSENFEYFPMEWKSKKQINHVEHAENIDFQWQ